MDDIWAGGEFENINKEILMNNSANNKKEVIQKSDEIGHLIEKIHTIRGRQVMLDRDLAILYGVETKRLNEQVRRNIERFPDDFMFQLSAEECSRSQIATLNIRQGQNMKYRPYAFTENGIAMLSSVLRSETAISANIRIMRTFTSIRSTVFKGNELCDRIQNIEYHQLEIHRHLSENDRKIEEIFDRIECKDINCKQGIFFDGQIFDAYSFVCSLIRKARKRIILIDNYIDDTVLTILDKREDGVNAEIYTSSKSGQINLDLVKHNEQYRSISLKIFSKAHDRFLIIDSKVYLIGASIKDLGKKWFGFTLMENSDAEDIINRLNDN